MATIGAASLILPDDPYELTSDPRTLPGLFDVLFMANASVHGRYDGTRTWSATVLLGRISASVSGPGLESRSTAAFRRLSTTIFDGHPTRLRDVQWTAHPVSSCLGMLMTGRVHYAVAHLASRYDTVTAQVVQLPDHSLVMAVSSVPDDAAPDVAAQAAAAVRSLTIR